jgi:hypothetical protein
MQTYIGPAAPFWVNDGQKALILIYTIHPNLGPKSRQSRQLKRYCLSTFLHSPSDVVTAHFTYL